MTIGMRTVNVCQVCKGKAVMLWNADITKDVEAVFNDYLVHCNNQQHNVT